MKRRKVLLIAAAIIATLGALLVFVYVHTANNRADARFDAAHVLVATKQISAGETVSQARAAGAIGTGTVSSGDVLPGVLTSLDGIGGDQVALSTIYPREQILRSKLGTTGSTALTIPKGKLAVSVSLTDPARVAGFVNPGNDVAIFAQGAGGSGTSGPFARMLLPKVEVIGVGSTTVVPTTTTDSSGAQTTEQLPRTLLTLAVSQRQAEKVLFADSNGTLAFGLLNGQSGVSQDAGVNAGSLFH